MKVVQVRGKTQPLNGALNVLLDVGGLVRDGQGTHYRAEVADVDAALGGNCKSMTVSVPVFRNSL